MRTAITLIFLSLAQAAHAQQEHAPPPLVSAPASASAPAAAVEPMKVGFHLESQGRTGPFVTGLIFASIGFLEASVYATLLVDESRRYSGTDSSTYVMYVPLVGPAISQVMFWNCRTCGGSFFGNADPFRMLITLTSTAAQVTGLALALIGGFKRTSILVADEPGFALAPGAPGAPLGVTLVLRN